MRLRSRFSALSVAPYSRAGCVIEAGLLTLALVGYPQSAELPSRFDTVAHFRLRSADTRLQWRYRAAKRMLSAFPVNPGGASFRRYFR